MEEQTDDPRVVAMLERNLQAILDGVAPEVLPPLDACELFGVLLALEQRFQSARDELADQIFAAAAAARRRHGGR